MTAPVHRRSTATVILVLALPVIAGFVLPRLLSGDARAAFVTMLSMISVVSGLAIVVMALLRITRSRRWVAGLFGFTLAMAPVASTSLPDVPHRSEFFGWAARGLFLIGGLLALHYSLRRAAPRG